MARRQADWRAKVNMLSSCPGLTRASIILRGMHFPDGLPGQARQ
jgi:hypothetical protein